MSHCSLFELVCVPNGACRHSICSNSIEVSPWHISICLHSNNAASHNSAFVPFPVCFHSALLLSLFSPLVSWLPHCVLYLYRWNSNGGVIEKLSCGSGWFVGPVHALIHPAALPHKRNIKQAIPEERKREGCGGERERGGSLRKDKHLD